MMKTWISILLFSSPVHATQITIGDRGARVVCEWEQSEDSSKGVIMVHQALGDSDDWDFFASHLKLAGFSTLAISLAPSEQSTEGWLGTAQQIDTAISWMTEQGIEYLAVVGAGLGANLSMISAAENLSVDNLVLLSPGLQYEGVHAEHTISTYGERPLFIAVSRQDPYSARSSIYFDVEARGLHHLEILTRAGHGTQMLTMAPSLSSEIVGWLTNSHDSIEVDLTLDSDITTGDTTALESNGNYLPLGLE